MIEDDSSCFWFLFLLEAIGSNTCSMLNCKHYWKRPDNDVSGALSLRTSLARLNFENDNFLVGKNSYEMFHRRRTNVVNFCFSSFGHEQFPAHGAGHMFLFHTLIRPLCYFDNRDWPDLIHRGPHCIRVVFNGVSITLVLVLLWFEIG